MPPDYVSWGSRLQILDVKFVKLCLKSPATGRMMTFPVERVLHSKGLRISAKHYKKEGQGDIPMAFNNTYGGCGVATIGSDCFATSLWSHPIRVPHEDGFVT